MRGRMYFLDDVLNGFASQGLQIAEVLAGSDATVSHNSSLSML